MIFFWESNEINDDAGQFSSSRWQGVREVTTYNQLFFSDKIGFLSTLQVYEKIYVRKTWDTPTMDEYEKKIGYPAVFLIDPKVMEKDIAYVGGGSANAVTKISPEELQKANNGRIFTIIK